MRRLSSLSGRLVAVVVAMSAAACGSEASTDAAAGSGTGGAGGAITGAASSSGHATTTTSSSATSSGTGATTTGAGGAGGGGGAAPFTCTGKAAHEGTDVVTFPSGGVDRTTLVHVPPGYDPDQGTMLVLNFHGYSSDAPQEALLSKMSTASDARGFLVAYPYGLFSSWNAGQCCGDAWTNSVDDIAFVAALVAELAAEYCVDPRRVYATGMSNGGFLSHRIGCELADTFAAIAPVAGVLGIPPAECTPSRPVPVMHFHGTDDPLVPFDGGVPLVGWDTGGLLDFPSVAETMAVWRAIDGCSDTTETTYQNGDSTCVRWTGCSAGSDVIRCVVEGGGHTWPGGMPVPTLGKTTTDLDATNAMLDFFEAHPMP